MKCPYCQNIIDDDSRWCDQCGKVHDIFGASHVEEIAKELDIPKNARVFLYAGVLNSRKNIVWLIDNFVQYHNENEYLLVLGKGDKEGECKKKADSHVKMLGFQPIGFLTDERYFVPTMVVSMIWKTFGWNTIIYLAAMTGIDPQLYEAATVDGANRWQRLLHITLPCIRSTIIVVLITRIGSLMQAGFEQIFVLYHPGVYGTADIIDTYVYRMGLQEGKFELASAVGLFKSVVNFILVVIANKTARMMGEEGIY